MDEKMKKIGMLMNIRMGLLMSFCLSFVGMFFSGHFTVPGYIENFLISAIMSILMGLMIPMGRVIAFMCQKFKIRQNSLGGRCLGSFVADTIYTPIITLVLVSLAYFNAMRQSGGQANLNFLGMYLSALLVCYIVGFVLIFIFQPLFLKRLMSDFE